MNDKEKKAKDDQAESPDNGAAQSTYTLVAESGSYAISGGQADLRHSVYTAVASASASNVSSDVIMALEPKFTNLEQPFLYALVHDNEKVGPRIGVEDVPESTLKSLAQFEWERRDSYDNVAKERRDTWRRGLALGAAIAGPAVALLGLVTKLLGLW